MKTDSAKTVTFSALSYSSGTLLSRFSGLFRDIAMAFCFGATAEVAAFMVAFRLANLLRRLFAESPLSSSFVPLFEEAREQSRRQGDLFFRNAFYHLSLVLLPLILMGMGITHFLPGLVGELTFIMFPSLLFICLAGLGGAYLQCQQKFFLSGVSPLAFNIVWIAGVLLLRKSASLQQVRGLSFIIVLAFLSQWLFTLPKILGSLRKSLSFREMLSFDFLDRDMKKAVRPFLLGIFGVGALQINSALDAFFARAASLEGPAYLWYAIRLEQVPLAFFGIALSYALLPSLARVIHDTRLHEELFQITVKRSLLLIFPSQLLLFVLGYGAIQLLFRHGQFSSEAGIATTYCLWGYSLALLPSSLVILFTPYFHSKQDYVVPTRAAFLSVICNCILNSIFVFVFKWGAMSIALATAFSSLVQMLYLWRKLPPIGDLKFAIRLSFSGVFAALATLLFGKWVFQDPTWLLLTGKTEFFRENFFFNQFLSTGTQGLLFLALFLMMLYGLRIHKRAGY